VTSQLIRTTVLQSAAAALVLASLGGCALAARVGAPACGTESVPKHASAAAAAYVDAVRTATPGWAAVSDRIHDQGNQMYPADYRDQIAVDEKFLHDVQAIEFPAEAQAAAARLEDALGAYIDFVRTSIEQPGYLSANRDVDDRVNNDRAAASAAIRKTLDLPPNGCVFNRP
jgi:hypothetical protein